MPALVGTAPAVVLRTPAIVAPGMRVSSTVNDIDDSVHNNVRSMTIDNQRNITVVNNITNVTIEAPATATANHRAVAEKPGPTEAEREPNEAEHKEKGEPREDCGRKEREPR